MKTISNNQGFTLVELMVSSGLLVIAMWALADMLVLSSKFQRNTSSESEINLLFDQVQGIAGAEWSCTAGLAGSNFAGAIVVNDPVTFAPVAREQNDTSGAWRLSQIRMQNVVEVAGQPGVRRGSLYLAATKKASGNIGMPMLSRTIHDIYFETNLDGTIARCYTTSDTVAAAQSACQLLGGTWNADSSNGSRCRLANTVGG